ncbi:hypothetical protein [Hansschlegelia plantiphila]|uniref:Uncharacterized protein n=1 Tax=Hansschlegelia plantiphila TaxID=374655 RepID=A0A9W6MW79_9HYPH|nr:hypothetical protein [Hansschlegelia plantiphila]GLK68547.1 hypothetical protein GCM10008179_21850 [Hansschlegelia plantiphila]
MTAQIGSTTPSLDQIEDDDDPRIQRVYRRLRMLTLIGALTMGVGFLSVMSVIAYRLVKSSPSAMGPTVRTLSLAPGARVVSTAVDGGRIVVTVETDGRTAIHVIDASSLVETGRIDVAPGGPSAPPLR